MSWFGHKQFQHFLKHITQQSNKQLYLQANGLKCKINIMGIVNNDNVDE